jgi:cell wall-associated NlpC family hydrolase
MPSPGPSPTPTQVRAGAPAWVAVSVATEWRSPSSPRTVDAPALANPAQIRKWLASMTFADQAGLIGRADSQILLGDRVQVLAVSGAWAKIAVPDQATPLDARGYPGYVPVGQLSAIAPPSTETDATVVSSTAWLMQGGVPAVEVSFATRLPVTGIVGSIAHLGLPGGAALDVALSAVVITSPGSAARPATAAAVIASVRQFLGVRYLWAGTAGFGFDCSGMMYNVFKVHGVLLPRDAQDQAVAGRAVTRAALQPGDLVFLASGGAVHHVALYIGSGMLLDSPDVGKPVQAVSMSAQPYASEFSGARRVLP